MNRRIMAVDDAGTIRRLVKMALKNTGCEVTEAENGAQALERLKHAPVDLIITDVNMPVMNGIELTRKLRSMPIYRKIPIVVLTTESDQTKKDQCRAAGATGWINKPFQQSQLESMVSKILPN